MSTHSIIALRLPSSRIVGCYVHLDGATMLPRIDDYLHKKSTDDLLKLVKNAQQHGGLRFFHSPPFDETDSEWCSEFLDDDESYEVDENNWNTDHFGSYARYLVDYDSSKVVEISKKDYSFTPGQKYSQWKWEAIPDVDLLRRLFGGRV